MVHLQASLPAPQALAAILSCLLTRLVGDLAEHVGRVTVGGERRRGAGREGSGTGEHAERSTAGLCFWRAFASPRDHVKPGRVPSVVHKDVEELFQPRDGLDGAQVRQNLGDRATGISKQAAAATQRDPPLVGSYFCPPFRPPAFAYPARQHIPLSMPPHHLALGAGADHNDARDAALGALGLGQGDLLLGEEGHLCCCCVFTPLLLLCEWISLGRL